MKEITIYSTPTCPYCVMAKRYLDDHKISYKEVDVSQDQKAAKDMQEKSGQLGVPVVIIKLDKDKEEVITGFDKDKIDKVLGITN
jgi:glutaredoxin 3